MSDIALAAADFEGLWRIDLGCCTREDLGASASGLRSYRAVQPRKEVIQPHVPVRLPCYDLVPITDPTFDACPSV